MATNQAIANAFGGTAGLYVQPGGTGDWYDHNGNKLVDQSGNPAIPVAGPNGVCIFTWGPSPPGSLTPNEWKVDKHCKAGHNCAPPAGVGSKTAIPLGTKIITNCP